MLHQAQNRKTSAKQFIRKNSVCCFKINGHKKMLNKKDNVYAFLIKSHFYMLDQAQNRKTLATAKQLIRKNSACCLNNEVILFTERM